MATTIRYDNDGAIQLVNIPVQDPGPGEVQLSGGVCGICSWDIVTCKLGDKMHPMAPPGHEGMGYVTKVGPGVTGFREGDRVVGGGFATQRNIQADRVYHIPDSDLDDRHWIVEPVSCAVTGLDHCRLNPGDRVVLIGCGFMGQLILQGLARSFAEEVTVVDIVPSRLELAQSLGATETVNSLDADAAELAAKLHDRNIDVVIDTSGSQAGLHLATDIVRRGGILNLFGWVKGQAATFDPTKWHLKGITVVNSSPSSKVRDTFPVAIRMIHAGIFDLRPLVTHVAPLPEYPSLMQQILAGDENYMKGVVTLD